MAKSLGVVDIFAGAGGLGEGFQQVGFEILSSLDSNYHCCQTLRTRIVYRHLTSINQLSLYSDYVCGKITMEQLCETFPILNDLWKNGVREIHLNEKNVGLECRRIARMLKTNGHGFLDVLIGGPPCQAYSLVGRSRDNHRKLYDDRHYLYRIYLRILQKLKPKIFLYENVPGLISAKSLEGEVIHHFIEDFKKLNPSYVVLRPVKSQTDLFGTDVLSIDHVRDFILDASEFGVPQKRKRFIMIGIRRNFWKPNQSVFHKLWPRILQKKVNKEVSVHDAIGDLPSLRAGDGCDHFFRRKYALGKPSSYASTLRSSTVGVLNHKARTHMVSDLERYYYFAKKAHKTGRNTSLTELAENMPELLPNHRNISTFLDRFKVQLRDKPASTVTAHIAKDGHYYIHPEPEQNRSLTVREAARLQSFPDNYYFEGPRTEQFRQVGNAVPPLFAKKIAEAIRDILTGIK